MSWFRKLKVLCVMLGAGALTAPVHSALAADAYPSKPITIVVAYTPGGANDIVGRLVAQHLSKELGQNVVVENKPGASGIVGTSAVARAEPDGYTLLLGAGGTMTMNPGLFKNLSYDSLKDFTPIGFAARSPLVVLVPPTLPVHSISELIAYAKSKKEGITFASPGSGTPLHLAGELFSKEAGVHMEHISYKGSAPALNDLMAGRVDVMFDVLGSSIQFINSEKLRALAVTTKKKSAQLPNVPTLDAQGLPGFDVSSWFAIFAPANTPEAIAAKLNKALYKMADSAEVKERLATIGMEPHNGTPEELHDFVASERTKWGQVIKEANIQIN